MIDGGTCRPKRGVLSGTGPCSSARTALLSQILGGFALLAAWSVQATDYHVAVTGDNGNAGDAANPFRDIQHAAALMNEGDLCVVHAGSYYEEVTPAAHNVSFVAAPGETVVVSGFEEVTGWTLYGGDTYHPGSNRGPVHDHDIGHEPDGRRGSGYGLIRMEPEHLGWVLGRHHVRQLPNVSECAGHGPAN